MSAEDGLTIDCKKRLKLTDNPYYQKLMDFKINGFNPDGTTQPSTEAFQAKAPNSIFNA